MSSSIKPNKPSPFLGRRDEFEVRTWIYQVKQYLWLVEVGNLTGLTEETKISFASTFFQGTAAAWWYTLVNSNSIPKTWVEFEEAIIAEFVPFDSVQRSRDKLRKLVQRTSVTSYLTEFRNIVLTIPGMSEGEKVDRFSQGLKPNIRLEVMKAGAQTMSDASRIALNVDSALFGAGMFRFQNDGGFPGSQYTPMEIGNVEQRDQDRSNNACCKCHKVGCRPWKCGKKAKQDQNTRRRTGQAAVSNTTAGKSAECDKCKSGNE